MGYPVNVNIVATSSSGLAASPWRPHNGSALEQPQDVFTPSLQSEWTPIKRPVFEGSAPSKAPEPRTPDGQTMAMSEFAMKRHRPETGCAYFTGTTEELMNLVAQGWQDRQPGTGRTNLDEVVVVPVPADKFMTTVVEVDPSTELLAGVTRRRSHEEPYIRVSAMGEAQPAKFAKVVLYSADTLAKNNERSIETDWEIVSLIASPVENEPMDPVTMMRNMRGKPGGTQVDYTADQLLDAIEFWSKHTKLSPAQ